MDWYYSKGEAQHGPISQDELVGKIGAGEVTSVDLAWREGMGDWKPVSSLAELQVAASPPTGAPVPPVVATPQGATPMGVAPTVSGMAIASLICGIVGFLGFFSCFLPGLVGIGGVICGHAALSQIKKSEGRVQGKGLAIGGLVTGYISTVLILGMIVLFGAAIIFSSPSESFDYEVDSIQEIEDSAQESPDEIQFEY